MRGRMNGSSRKITEEQKITVPDHIQSFPAFESPYIRSHNANRKFLHPDLNIKKMLKVKKIILAAFMNGVIGKSVKTIIFS